MRAFIRSIAAMAALGAAAALAQPAPDLTPPTGAAPGDCLSAASGAPPQGGWYRASPSNTVIVFVHGILSDSRAAWLTPGTPCAFWPALVAGDTERLGRPAIFLGGYHSQADSGAATLRDVAAQLFSSLAAPSGQPLVSPLAHSRIVFVAHSLGGIVVRRMLVEHAADFADRDVAVLLYASPAGGSAYADLLSWLQAWYPHALLRELQTDAPALEQTNERFRALLVQRREAGRPIRVAEFFEARFPRRDCAFLNLGCAFVSANMPEIVPLGRAGQFDLPAERVPDTDHVTIVKPRHADDDSHRRLVLTLARFGAARATAFAQGLGRLSVSGVLPRGQWVRDGEAADLVTQVGALCDGQDLAADSPPLLCRSRHEVPGYGRPPRDGDIGFVVLHKSVRNVVGKAELDVVTFPGAAGSEQFERTPVISAMDAVLRSYQAPAQAPLSALFTVRFQPLRYRVSEEPWHREVVVPAAANELVEVPVPAGLQSAEVAESSIAGDIRRSTSALAAGSRLGLMELQDVLRRGEERIYRFVKRPR